MDRIDYLYMFRTEGCDPTVHRREMDTPLGHVTVVGVDSADQACAEAAIALANGTAHFVELCGDFGEDGCRKVIAAVGGRLPVGYVTYFPEEEVKVARLFAGAS
jgi:hypothetical protein